MPKTPYKSLHYYSDVVNNNSIGDNIFRQDIFSQHTPEFFLWVPRSFFLLTPRCAGLGSKRKKFVKQENSPSPARSVYRLARHASLDDFAICGESFGQPALFQERSD
jgi:hypothetical protein